MPKSTWNINDFSGGVNNIVEPRDLNDNECTRARDLVAYNPGALKLEGYFQSFSHTKNTLGLSDYDNLFTFLAPKGFLIYGRAQVTRIDSTYAKFEVIDADGNVGGYHGMNIDSNNGNIIHIYKSTLTIGVLSGDMEIYENQRLNVLDIGGNESEFKVEAAIAAGNQYEVEYIINGNYTYPNSGIVLPDLFDANINVNYILMCSPKGEFGFYNVENGNWYGGGFGNPSYPNAGPMGSTPYLFDICNTWDWRQPNSYNAFTGITGDGIDDSAMIRHAFYHDGAFRVMPVTPSHFYANHCMRPVGLYYIRKHIKFAEPVVLAEETQRIPMTYYSGWYPLTSHILSPCQIGRNWDSVSKSVFIHPSQNENITTQAGQAEVVDVAATTAVTMYDEADAVTLPNMAGRFGLAVNATASVIGGLWDFSNATTGAHANIKFGVSLLYDDIDEFGQQQESNIDPLKNTITLTTGSNCALNICLVVKKGSFSNQNTLAPGLSDASDAYTSKEDVGAYTNSGAGNPNAWNPRIVGANIYILRMGTRTGSGGDDDHSIKTLDDPLYLATFNFYGDSSEYGLSKAFDGTLASKWNEGATDGATIYHTFQAIRGIKDIPIERFYAERQAGAYKHDECISAWYNTSTVINNRLYAGDVSYFPNTRPIENEGDIFYEKPEHHPDHILVSPVGKLDILPTKHPIQIARLDSQQIIELESYGPFLFVFKSNDLVIIDPTGSPGGNEAIYQTFYGQGVTSSQQTVKAPQGIYYITKRGLYLCNGEENVNLGINKFDTVTWNKIVSHKSKIMYVPEYELIFITTKFNGKLNETSGSEMSEFFDNILYYNTLTGAFFFKQVNDLEGKLQSDVSNGVTVKGSLFLTHNTHTSMQFGSEYDEISVTEQVQYANAVSAYTMFWFITKAGGGIYASGENELNWEGNIAEAGQLSHNIDFIKIKKASDNKWYSFNEPSGGLWEGLEPLRRKVARETGVSPASYLTVASNATETVDAINALNNLELADGTEYSIAAGKQNYYYDDDGNLEHIRCYIQIKSKGPKQYDSASNLVAEDLSSSVGSAYGETAVAFASKGDDQSAADDGNHITTGTNTTGTINSINNSSTGQVRLNVPVGHPFVPGDSMTISGTTNYNGTFQVLEKINIGSEDALYIYHDWDGSESGAWSYNTAQLQVGNLLDDNLSGYSSTLRNAQTPVAYKFRVQIDRNDRIASNAIFSFTIFHTTSMLDDYENTFEYITDNAGMFNNSEYDWLNDSDPSLSTNQRNDNAITNFRNGLADGTISSSGDLAYSNFANLSDRWNIGAVTGTSGEKYFDIELGEYMTNYEDPYGRISYSIDSSVIQGSATTVTSHKNDLLKWNNEYNEDLQYIGDLEYVTKDIDFGEPGVRKKVYKAYVTYTGGGGFIKCYYKANGIGTGGAANDESNWTLCNAFNASGGAATNSGRLNTSDTQTKGSLTFGSGGNNVNSFQLKFILDSASESISNFEINDITIIYRLKNPI